MADILLLQAALLVTGGMLFFVTLLYIAAHPIDNELCPKHGMPRDRCERFH